jgi:hypothetical protein
MTQSISQKLVLVFRFDWHIVLVSLCMVIMFIDWPVFDLLVPLFDITRPPLHLIGSIRNECIFIVKCVFAVIDIISSLKSEVLELR